VYLLRVGYGGTLGALTDIDKDGFASAAFHSFPDMLKPDPYSGDYGPNFFGYAWNTATYLVDHPEFGWVAFGGNVKMHEGVVTIIPRDSFRSRIFIGQAGLWLTLDAGTFDALEYDPGTRSVRVGLSKANDFTSDARLRVEQPGKTGISTYHPELQTKLERGAYVIPLSKETTWVALVKSNE
jgi:hypothetical protein